MADADADGVEGLLWQGGNDGLGGGVRGGDGTARRGKDVPVVA